MYADRVMLPGSLPIHWPFDVCLLYDLLPHVRTVSIAPAVGHQDQPYYNVSGSQNVSFWIPVDKVPAAASLLFAAGSHIDGTW